MIHAYGDIGERPRPKSHRAAALVAVVTFAACGPLVGRGSFRQIPGSVQPAFLLGPYDGQVQDRDSGRPIEKATVWCSWAFERGIGFPEPHGARTFETLTDADGRYRIPRLESLPSGLTTRLARFALRVYKRGYVVYQHDRVFDSGAHRFDFSQHEARVQLVRWDQQSHSEHLLFAAGGVALRRATYWERAQAARELDAAISPEALAGDIDLEQGSNLRPGVGPTNQAASLLDTDDLRSVTGYEGVLRVQPLAEAGDATATVHFRAVNESERFDVALRLWRLRGTALNEKYETIVSALEGEPSLKIGDQAFIAVQGDIAGMAFVDEARDALVLLTCGTGQCPTEDELVAVARLVERGLTRLPELPDDESPDLPDDESPEPAELPEPTQTTPPVGEPD